MKLAIDSSSIAKKYVQEEGSDKLDLLLANASELAFCAIMVPEIVSALNRRLRERVLSAAAENSELYAEYIGQLAAALDD